MQFTCDCLNVVISTAATVFSSCETFKDCLPDDYFFKEDVALLCYCSVSVQVPSLIRKNDIGDWNVVTCINCGQACYSTGNNLPLDSLVVKRNLEKEKSQINALRSSKIYSPIFKILIYDNDTALEGDFENKTTLYPAALMWLSEQTAKAEERIKSFTEKEYMALDDLRKRAYKDQIAIIKKEKDSLKEKKKKCSVEDTNEPIKVTSIPQSFVESAELLSDNSLDAEGVFLLEEFENSCNMKNKNYESDSEGSDETEIYASRKIGISQLAKSLPIPVPQFMEDRHCNDPNGSPQVPSDIAASIRALAKSVHGDAIFGELPQPRFSTHL